MFEAVSVLETPIVDSTVDLAHSTIGSPSTKTPPAYDLSDVDLGRLIASMQRGGSEGNLATIEINRRFKSRLLTYAANILTHRDRSSVEDVVQEGLERVRASTTIDLTRSDRDLSGYLFAAVRSVAIQFNRKAEKMPVNLTDYEKRSALGDSDIGASIAERTDANNPITVLQRAEAIDRVRAAIASLPEIYIPVCQAVMLMELSYQETAQLLEIPLGTVQSRIHRATVSLAKLLAPYNTVA